MASPTTHLDLDNTFGAYLIGTFLGFLLYGFLLYQVYEYCRLYNQDCIALKSLVALVVFLQTVFGIFNVHTCYHYLVTNYFVPEALHYPVWSIAVIPLFVGITVVVTQSFFARRAFMVGHRYRLVAGIVIVLFVAELVLDTVGTFHAFTIKGFSKAKETTWLAAAASVIMSLVDLLISTVLIIALHRSRSGFKHTDSVISVVIMYTINTGLLTGVVHVVLWIICFVYPTNLIYSLPGIVMERLYGNVLLATLNARISLSKRGMHTFGVVTEFPSDPSTTESRSGRPRPGQSTSATSGDIIELKSWNTPQVQGETGQNNVDEIPELPPKVHGGLICEDGTNERCTEFVV